MPKKTLQIEAATHSKLRVYQGKNSLHTLNDAIDSLLEAQNGRRDGSLA